MSKLLVLLHIYYHEQTDYFLEKLKNINGVEWDLVVTSPTFDEATEKKIKEFKPETSFLGVRNCGYDIWPFIKAVQCVDLSQYDYVMKLHTKRDVESFYKINHTKMAGSRWRDALVDSLLHSPEYFKRLIGMFEKNPRLGMVSALLTQSNNAWDIYEGKLGREFKRLNLPLRKGLIALGTMFMARADVFTPLQKDWLTADYFSDQNPVSGSNFSKSHIYERLLSLLPVSMDMTHKGVSPSRLQTYWLSGRRAMKGPMEWMFGLYRKGPYHRKAMRIMGFEFYIGKPQEVNFTEE